MLTEKSLILKEEADVRAKNVLRLREGGLSYIEITKITGYSKRLISRYLKRAGYKGLKRVFDKAAKEKSIELYNKNLSILDISKSVGFDASTVRDYFISIGLETNLNKRLSEQKDKLIMDNYVKGITIESIVSKTGLSKNYINKYMRKKGLLYGIKTNKRKVCICGFEGGIEDFKGKLCKGCIVADVINTREMNYEQYVKFKLNSIYSSATKRGFCFELSYEYLYKILKNDICPLTHKKMTREGKDNMSIDRFDNSKGYIEGNIIPCRLWINEKKGDMSLEELKEYMPIVYERGKKFLESL